MPENQNILLVRLRPYAPRQGFVMRRYSAFGIRFEEGRGWYEVPRSIGEYLKTVHEAAENPGSPLAFDVCTREGARQLEETEKRLSETAVAAANAPRITRLTPAMRSTLPQPKPISADLTTADLGVPGQEDVTPTSTPVESPPKGRAPRGRRASP